MKPHNGSLLKRWTPVCLTSSIPLVAIATFVAVTGISLLSVFLFAGTSVAQQAPASAERGLLVLYDFTDGGDGRTIHDRSATGEPLDLVIEKSNTVRWLSGTLVVKSATTIVSRQPARKIIDAVKRSNAISIEAWVKPASGQQGGPARILSLSKDTGQRNFTLGQDNDAYDVRLRATGSDKNGLPSTASPKKSLRPRLTHVVFTRDPSGSAMLFIDGKQVTQKKVGGNFESWDAGYHLCLANEFTQDRPWLGEFSRVAVYDRALSAGDIQRNFKAGAAARPQTPATSEVAAAQHIREFDAQVAPLLAKHCLECHDSAIKKGGLDLSRKTAALAGGDSGKAILPGKSASSSLWQAVADNEMPKERPPLSPAEKAALKKWLDDGAAWSSEVIDPAIYQHEGHAGEVWVQRLTIPEYIATVRAAVGVEIGKEAREILPPDLRADGFSNTAYNLNVDLKHVEAYSKLAELIVERMDVLRFAGRFNKSRKLSTDDTMRDQVAAMGKWLLRGPLEQQEVDDFSGIATTVASAGGDFELAMRLIIEAMLQSPRFVYRIEDHHGDGGSKRVGQYELASRLSYILWGAPPDAQLMQAADKGELADRSKLEAQVRRMLQDPRAIDRSLQFVADWLNLGRLENLRPNTTKFPAWNAQLADDMREETLAFFQEVAWTQQRPLSDLLNAQFTFATPRLAAHYGLNKNSGSGGQSKTNPPQRYDLSKVSDRGGLLTQGSVLTIGGDDASMVSRGLFVLHDLLRGTVNAPPPCVNTTPPPTKAGLTQRGIAESRIANENCGICHARFEPLAFGLERFDGIGAHHEKDQHGNILRDDGHILFPGESQPVPYQTSAELMDLLAGHERVKESLTWKVTQFALGRPLVAEDAPLVTAIHETAQRGGGTWSSLMTAIVMSDLVQNTRTEKK